MLPEDEAERHRRDHCGCRLEKRERDDVCLLVRRRLARGPASHESRAEEVLEPDRQRERDDERRAVDERSTGDHQQQRDGGDGEQRDQRDVGTDGRRKHPARVWRPFTLDPMTLVTTVVGSYPQPEWLIDRERLGDRLPPRVRARELWRVPEPYLEEAQDDATRLAVRDMERAGVDVITDGEMRRESYSNRFATALEGIDLDNPGVALDRTGHENPVPRVVGPIRRAQPVEVRDVEFLRSLTDRRIKITVPGPFTMTQQAQNDHYSDERSLALAYAEAVNEELRDLKAAGADVVQIDEPYLQARPEAAASTRSRRSTAPSTGSTATPCCTRASATRTSSTTSPRATRSCASSTTARRRTSRSRRRSPVSTLRSCATLPSKTILLGVLDLGSTTRSRRRRSSPSASGGRSRSSGRSGWSSRPTAG